jgi:type III secretion protein C
LLAVSAWAPPCAAVTPVAWKDTLYSYRGGGAALGERLEALAHTMGLRLRLQDGKLAKAPARPETAASNVAAYLDRLAAEQRFQWFVYNGTLYVSDGAVTERLSLGGMSGADARQALIGLGLFEEKFGWGELDDTACAVVVAGPPAYVALLKDVIGKRAGSDETPQLMVFRLKHAMAADHEIATRERVTVLPGVATVLRELLATRGTAAQMDTFRGPGPLAMAAAAEGPGLSAPAASSPRLPISPTIDVYAPLNAVLVRDLPDRRAMYQDLVTALDVAVDQVEILVTIVDATSGTLRDWSAGLTWNGSRGTSGADSNGRAVIGDGGAGQDQSGAANLVLWPLSKLNLKLRALESEGALHVVSRPSLLTQDNFPAVLDMSQSAYIKLLGERSSDLKGLTVGTMLKVTPRVIGDTLDPSIQVLVDIEDGKITNPGNNETSAQTERNSISTQAVVRPGQALVIGGYRRKSDQTDQSRVPGLSRIPLLGRLFKGDHNSSEQSERLFILTARVVPKGAANGASVVLPPIDQTATKG